MIPTRTLSAVVALSLLFSPTLRAVPEEAKGPDMGQVADAVVRILESSHYSRQKLNQPNARGVIQAREALRRYFELLDYNRLFFTQKDIDEFEQKYGDTVQYDIPLGDLEAAYTIYDRYVQKVEARVAKIKELLAQDFTFDSDRSAEINRDKLPWPADEAEADRIWRNRIEAELLQAKLAERALEEAAAKKKDSRESAKAADGEKPAEPASNHPKRTPKETVQKRYERLLKSLAEETRDDQASTFLAALAQSYDPHSEYMSQRQLDNFNIQMKLSLFGIGAVLRSEDGYAKIAELVPGGPADRGGQLKVNDRIVAVAQGNGEFEDVVDMKLDKVVERIRGKKGTTVRLQVLPGASADPSKLEVVTIVRDEVQLKEQEAKAQVIDAPGDGDARTRIGWITLPSFYAEMGRDSNRQGAKSTTRDVSALLKRLKKEGIEGLVIDLRRDSGGSLDEAIRLTGLFIPRGPVVQAKDTNGTVRSLNDPDPGVQWDGPLVVLVNRLSASASEIFAAALQDYGRAVIVGDERSFGKGTVQTLVEVGGGGGTWAPWGGPDLKNAGAIKFTIQKYYRVKGGSTQLKGVASDIVLPSLTDQPEVGESALKNPLDYDEVAARQISSAGDLSAIIPALRAKSEARIAANPEFAYIKEDRTRLFERIEANEVSLNKAKRTTEIDEDKTRREARLAERKQRTAPAFAALEVTLDTVDAPQLQKVALDKPPKRAALEEAADEDADPSAPDEEEPFVDPIRDEAIFITQDLIRLAGAPAVTARAEQGTAPARP